eukprot:g4325.t1
MNSNHKRTWKRSRSEDDAHDIQRQRRARSLSPNYIFTAREEAQAKERFDKSVDTIAVQRSLAAIFLITLAIVLAEILNYTMQNVLLRYHNIPMTIVILNSGLPIFVLLWYALSKRLGISNERMKIECFGHPTLPILLGICKFGVSFFFYSALPITLIAPAQAIANSETAFNYVVALICFGEKREFCKSLGVILCILGVLLVYLGNRDQDVSPIITVATKNSTTKHFSHRGLHENNTALPNDPNQTILKNFTATPAETIVNSFHPTPWGYVLVLFTVLCTVAEHNIFKVYANKFKGSTDSNSQDPTSKSSHSVSVSTQVNDALFKMTVAIRIAFLGLGQMGFVSIIFAAVMAFTVGEVTWPEDDLWQRIVASVIVNALLHGALFCAISIFEPVLVSLGLVLMVPISVFMDIFLGNTLQFFDAVGSALVLASFVMINFAHLPGVKKQAVVKYTELQNMHIDPTIEIEVASEGSQSYFPKAELARSRSNI